MTKRLLFATLAAAVFLHACKKDENLPAITPNTNPNAVLNSDLDATRLNRLALDYYTDQAVMMEFYVDHPAQLQEEIRILNTTNAGDTSRNKIVEEYIGLEITGDDNKRVAFLDLPDSARHFLMKSKIKFDAKVLSDKLEMVPDPAIDDDVERMNTICDVYIPNSAYRENLDFDAERGKISVADPFRAAQDELVSQLQPMSRSVAPEVGQGPVDFQSFLADLAALRVLGVEPALNRDPRQTVTPQQFVDKFRNEMVRGRILVSLPGGASTKTIMFMYPSSQWYDVGHVAVISKNKSELPGTITGTTSISIGTDSKNGMHHEEVADGWSDHHGMSFLMQATRNRYEFKKIMGVPYFVEVKTEDLDNAPIHRAITSVLGKPYCLKHQMVFSCKMAPDRFICSSSAWWAIKEAHGIDIDPWSLMTVWPKDVYLSSNMRVVVKSF